MHPTHTLPFFPYPHGLTTTTTTTMARPARATHKIPTHKQAPPPRLPVRANNTQAGGRHACPPFPPPKNPCTKQPPPFCRSLRALAPQKTSRAPRYPPSFFPPPAPPPSPDPSHSPRHTSTPKNTKHTTYHTTPKRRRLMQRKSTRRRMEGRPFGPSPSPPAARCLSVTRAPLLPPPPPPLPLSFPPVHAHACDARERREGACARARGPPLTRRPARRVCAPPPPLRAAHAHSQPPPQQTFFVFFPPSLLDPFLLSPSSASQQHPVAHQQQFCPCNFARPLLWLFCGGGFFLGRAAVAARSLTCARTALPSFLLPLLALSPAQTVKGSATLRHPSASLHSLSLSESRTLSPSKRNQSNRSSRSVERARAPLLFLLLFRRPQARWRADRYVLRRARPGSPRRRVRRAR